MTTDDERREVARRLRGQAKKLGPNMDAHEFAHYTADVIDVNECMTWYEMELRLADLIEPSCDRDALLALADEIHGLVENQEIRFFHVVQVHESTLATIERRIRKALGVTDG